MKDIQNTPDTRGIAIQRVGIKDAKLPFQIKTKEGGYQTVLADIRFTVALPRHLKGTHMSRFMEILSEWGTKPVAEKEMEDILRQAIVHLDADSALLSLGFKYFISKIAPVSGKPSLLDVDCKFIGELTKAGKFIFTLEVDVPYTSLCPCSKEISDYGAHNQRGKMSVTIRFKEDKECIFIEDLVQLMEAQASCPVYPLLKRVDEKFVTEAAFDNPKFVEDILRDLVIALRSLDGQSYFRVECENYESIHNHNAYAAHEESADA